MTSERKRDTKLKQEDRKAPAFIRVWASRGSIVIATHNADVSSLRSEVARSSACTSARAARILITICGGREETDYCSVAKRDEKPPKDDDDHDAEQQ